MRRPLIFAALLALLAVVAPAARAVIINSETGIGNTTAPLDDPGWNNVSLRGNGTAVYLGNGWVLTANHTLGGNMTFNGQTYSEVPSTAFALTNNGLPDKTANTDLKLFKINGIPAGLPTLSIAATTPSIGAAVTMIGAGRDRSDFTRWDASTSPWTEVPTGGSAFGYKSLSTRTLRWGTNAVSNAADWLFFDNRDVLTLRTTFNSNQGPNEAQAVVGDSGGAVFVKNGGQWELAGIMTAVNAFVGQPSPGETAVFGNQTYFADLSFYRSQIVAVVPEPGGAALAGVALAACAAWAALRRA